MERRPQVQKCESHITVEEISKYIKCFSLGKSRGNYTVTNMKVRDYMLIELPFCPCPNKVPVKIMSNELLNTWFQSQRL